MKTLLLSIILLFQLVADVLAAGLGSKFADFEQEWNKGYRKESVVTNGLIDVNVGRDKKHSIAYSKGGWRDFDGRIGEIHGEAWGLFGAAEYRLPTTKQFLDGTRSMMPADSKLIAKYTSSEPGWLREVYLYKSDTLSRLPGISKSSAYNSKAIGKFILLVNHDIDSRAHVMNFTLCLGSGDTDIRGMKKVKATTK